MTFLILVLLSLSALALLAAILFLYRYLMRSHLFPQLPRVWRVERTRFLLCAILFVACFSGFLVVGWLGRGEPEVEPSVIYQTQPSQNQPSFDGAPPSPVAPNSQERALPPRISPPPEPVAQTQPAVDQAQPPMAPVTPDKSDQSVVPDKSVKPITPPAKPAAPPATEKPLAIAQGKPDILPQGSKPEPKPYVPDSPAPAAAPDKPKPYVPEPGDAPAALSVISSSSGQSNGQPMTSSPGLPVPTAPTGSTKGVFSVCVASYPTEAGAHGEIKNFAHLGATSVVAADLPGKGRWYRICVGEYPTQAAAQVQVNKLRSQGQTKGAFVVRLP